MQPVSPVLRIGYVLKMYPRFSETFILNELLAHEEAGLELEVFSLYLPTDGKFHDALSRLRAPVTYLENARLKAADLWAAMRSAAPALPALWESLAEASTEDAREVAQAIRLAQMVKERGITHLHAHFATTSTTVARLAARLAGITYSFTAHAKDIYHDDTLPDVLRRKLYDAAAVITVSDFNLAFLRQHYGPAAQDVYRVYNGVDLEEFPFAAPDQQSRTGPEIIAVGRLVEKKGFDDLIEACRILRDRGMPCECQIIGSGPEEERLRERIHERSLTGCVHMVGGLPRGEVISRVQAASVLAAPCVVGADGNRDGLPTVLLEAMALGTPCIATDVTGIPEAVIDGETGLLTPQRNPQALATGIARLLKDTRLRLQLAHAARRLVEAEFDIRRNAALIRDRFAQAARPRHERLEEAVP